MWKRSCLQDLPARCAKVGLAIFFMTAVNLFWGSPVMAATNLPIFGPERYVRLQGGTTVYNGSFESCVSSNLATIRVQNGGNQDTRISSAEVYLNGAVIFRESDFDKKTRALSKQLRVLEVNHLKIVLKSGRHADGDELHWALEKKILLERELNRLRADNSEDHEDKGHEDKGHEGDAHDRRLAGLRAELAALREQIDSAAHKNAPFLIVEVIGQEGVKNFV